MNVKVLPNQTLTDIAMQVYGTAESVFVLAEENELSVTSELQPEQTLFYSPKQETEKKVTQYFTSHDLYPATVFISPELVFDNTFDNTFRSYDKNE